MAPSKRARDSTLKFRCFVRSVLIVTGTIRTIRHDSRCVSISQKVNLPKRTVFFGKLAKKWIRHCSRANRICAHSRYCFGFWRMLTRLRIRFFSQTILNFHAQFFAYRNRLFVSQNGLSRAFFLIDLGAFKILLWFLVNFDTFYY